jgi:hypothetical protein
MGRPVYFDRVEVMCTSESACGTVIVKSKMNHQPLPQNQHQGFEDHLAFLSFCNM